MPSVYVTRDGNNMISVLQGTCNSIVTLSKGSMLVVRLCEAVHEWEAKLQCEIDVHVNCVHSLFQWREGDREREGWGGDLNHSQVVALVTPVCALQLLS